MNTQELEEFYYSLNEEDKDAVKYERFTSENLKHLTKQEQRELWEISVRVRKANNTFCNMIKQYIKPRVRSYWEGISEPIIETKKAGIKLKDNKIYYEKKDRYGKKGWRIVLTGLPLTQENAEALAQTMID